MLEEDLLQASYDRNSDQYYENPYVQQRSNSMFLQNDINNDLIDYNIIEDNANNAYFKKTKVKRQSGSKQKKRNESYEAKNLANKVQHRIQEENRKNVFPETSKEQEERIRRNSPYGGLLTWKLFRVIVKSNDDVRQEQFAIQLISQFD